MLPRGGNLDWLLCLMRPVYQKDTIRYKCYAVSQGSRRMRKNLTVNLTFVLLAAAAVWLLNKLTGPFSWPLVWH